MIHKMKSNEESFERVNTDKLKENLEKFVPYNEQEETDKRIMLKYLKDFDDVLTRQNEYGHFTSSAFILNKERTKLLMIYHKIYNSWAWTGGHSDGDNDLLYVAMKEAKEETGIKNVRPISEDTFTTSFIGNHFTPLFSSSFMCISSFSSASNKYVTFK